VLLLDQFPLQSSLADANFQLLLQEGEPLLNKVRVEPRPTEDFLSLEALSDEDLVNRVRDGMDAAYSALFHRHYSHVLNVAVRILKNREEAEDATQTVFWDISRAFHLYNSARGSFRTWLMQYAYHRSINHKKSLQTRGLYQHDSVDCIDRQVLQEALHSPSRKLLPSEASHAVHQALAHLSQPQRDTLKMIFLEGLTFADVALRFKQTEGNVRHHYYRGMRKLREILLLKQ
jgi:RNA polymerase sigma-70 factor (ECF subfamily)